MTDINDLDDGAAPVVEVDRRVYALRAIPCADRCAACLGSGDAATPDGTCRTCWGTGRRSRPGVNRDTLNRLLNKLVRAADRVAR